MTKIVGCMAVHYGKEYLAYAAKSLGETCDRVHVFYSAKPSFGFSEQGLECPDSEPELKDQAARFLGKKLTWHKLYGVTREQQHRDAMLSVARSVNAGLVVIADADEVWEPASLRTALDSVDAAHKSGNGAGRWLARFYNFWRSWRWRVSDSFRPVRIVDLRYPLDRDAYLDEVTQPLPVYHFGYAQTLATMRYKMGCHGHKREFRPGWMNRFESWTPTLDGMTGLHTDLHPCVTDLWTAEATDWDTIEVLNRLMPDHPHRDLAVIA